MSDYSELKRLAEAALRNWPDSKLFERPECERFIDATRPDVVLALISEVEGLRHGWYSDECCNIRFWPEELSESKQEIDRLEAEVESLRKDAERYHWIRQGEGEAVIIVDPDNASESGICPCHVIIGDEVDEYIDDILAREAEK